MNRRAFLSLFGVGAAGMVLDPERLLWVPGQRTYFLPSGVEPFHGLVTPDWITQETMRILSRSLKFAANIDRTYDDAYRDVTAGQTLTVRLPQRFQVAA